jgi:hypothetical protein
VHVGHDRADEPYDRTGKIEVLEALIDQSATAGTAPERLSAQVLSSSSGAAGHAAWPLEAPSGSTMRQIDGSDMREAVPFVEEMQRLVFVFQASRRSHRRPLRAANPHAQSSKFEDEGQGDDDPGGWPW